MNDFFKNSTLKFRPDSLLHLCLEFFVKNEKELRTILPYIPSEIRETFLNYFKEKNMLDNSRLALFLPYPQTYFSFNKNTLDSSSFDSIPRHWYSLQTLDLSGCTLSLQFFQELAFHSKNLEVLVLADVEGITDASVREICNLSKLQHLSLKRTNKPNTKLSNLCCNYIAQYLPGLKYLDLSLCTLIKSPGFRTIFTNCNQLIYLYLEGNRCIVDDDIQVLCTSLLVNTLRHLNLSGLLKLSNQSIQYISNSLILYEIDFSNNNLINDDGIDILTQSQTELRKIALSYCNTLTDLAAQYISTRCLKLESIQISHSARLSALTAEYFADLTHLINCVLCIEFDVTDQFLMKLASNCPHLKNLNLWMCNNLTDASIQVLSEKCPGLEVLFLSDASKLSSKTLRYLGNCSSLHTLVLGGVNVSDRFDDASFQFFVSKCSNLKILLIVGLSVLKDESIFELAKSCPNLTTLDLRFCDNITDLAIYALAKNCPKLESIDLRNCPKLENIPSLIESLVDKCSISQITISKQIFKFQIDPKFNHLIRKA